MTLIPRQEEKNCFIACSEDKVKQGHCDCVNRMQNQAFNIPHVVGQSEQLKCHHQYMNAGTLQGEAMKKCLRCGDYVKAL